MSSTNNQVMNINITETELGFKWNLAVIGKTIGGGYAKNMWQALDAVNDKILEEFHQPLGRYYQSQIAGKL